jgi:hypothetical protein
MLGEAHLPAPVCHLLHDYPVLEQVQQRDLQNQTGKDLLVRRYLHCEVVKRKSEIALVSVLAHQVLM